MKTELKIDQTINPQMPNHFLKKDSWSKANYDGNVIKIHQTYKHELTPFLKDSNAYGNIYFARYFEWQGICREMWFTECIYSNMFEMDGAFLTRAAHNDYVQEVLPFQKIYCELNINNLKKTCFDLLFKFFNEKSEIVSKGYQTVVYTDLATKCIKKLPADVIAKVKRYQIV
ncbi:MAG: acyl-CoA thioesterase [Porticoccaceae bacterium]